MLAYFPAEKTTGSLLFFDASASEIPSALMREYSSSNLSAQVPNIGVNRVRRLRGGVFQDPESVSLFWA